MVQQASPFLSIILVHYHAPQFLFDCIKSVYDQTQKYLFEIIVVDNGSKNDFEKELLAKFPEVKFIGSGYNAGFARANNIGMLEAKGEFILLLNSDTIIINNALSKCVDHFKNDNAIACGVQLLNNDNTPQISGSYFVKGGLNFLLPLPYLGKVIRTIAFSLNAKVPHAKPSERRTEVDWINGAFLMIKRAVLSTAGFMDEDFFLYAEETEWCSRIKRKENWLFMEILM